MKKILFITRESLSDPKRGTPIRILNLVREMQRDHQVVVASPLVDKNLIHDYCLYPSRWWSRFQYFSEIIRAEGIDIVMTSTDIDIDLPVWLKWRTGVKIALDLHGLYAAEMCYQGHMGRVKSWVLQQKINSLIRFYDLVLPVSPKLLDFYGSRIKKGVVVYGGVTESDFYRGPVSQPEVFTIGYTGNAKPYQGIDNLLAAAVDIKRQNLFPFRLNLIMSSGQGEIEEKLKSLGLFDLASLTYKVSHKEVPRLIARSSVLVIARPSVDMTEYAYPSKLPEYLATGIPVVATRVGPIEALFRDQDFLIVIDPANPVTELVQALLKLNRLSVAERARMGARAIQFVRDYLTWEHIGRVANQALGSI